MHFVRFLLFAILSLVAFSAGAVDLNQASESELRQIKGIGPKTAENIIAERMRGGPFDSLQDLSDRVKGIGPKRVISLRTSGLTVGEMASSEVNTTAAHTQEN